MRYALIISPDWTAYFVIVLFKYLGVNTIVMSCEMRRVKLQFKQPNPLFEKWLIEWRDEAAAKDSNMQFCFAKALSSLRKYPLPLQSGRDCGILQNFGKKLCMMLDSKLAKYKEHHPEVIGYSASVPLRSVPSESQKPPSKGTSSKRTMSDKMDSKKKKSLTNGVKRKAGVYIPSYRSGAYAILLSLLSASKEERYQGFAEKEELLKLAQPLCDASFTNPQAGSFYTAWSSMSALVKKGLVLNAGHCKYSLTTDGQILAERLQSSEGEKEDESAMQTEVVHGLKLKHDAIPSSSSASTTRSQDNVQKPAVVCHKGKQKTDNCENVIFSPGSFDVILLVDTHEAKGNSDKKQQRDSPLNDLPQHNIQFEIRHLTIGDYVWICKDRSSGHEVVLPYIIERKRVDDLAKSIMDGRFREQKFRLKRCGIPNLIYLVEKHGKELHTALPLSTLNQAAANSEVRDGFSVKYTGNHKETASYLALFTHFLNDLFMVKTLVTCCKKDLPSFSVNDDLCSLMSFQEFNSSSKKNKPLSVRDMFIKQLVQLKGLSVEKALAIVKKYPTPYTLFIALRNQKDPKLLADISCGALNRRIGPVLSKKVCDLYSNSSLL